MIIGLYVVIWAKDKCLEEIKQDTIVELLHESFREQDY